MWSSRVQVWALPPSSDGHTYSSSFFPGAPRDRSYRWIENHGNHQEFPVEMPKTGKDSFQSGEEMRWDGMGWCSHLLKGHLTVSGDIFNWPNRRAGMASNRPKKRRFQTCTKHNHHHHPYTHRRHSAQMLMVPSIQVLTRIAFIEPSCSML